MERPKHIPRRDDDVRDEPLTDDEVRGETSISGWGDHEEKRNPVPPTNAPETQEELEGRDLDEERRTFGG